MVDMQQTVLYCFFLLISLFESTFQQQLRTLSSPAEFLTLLELRSSLGLRSKDWPIKADPCKNWNGITCRNGSVVEINISGFKRTRIGRQNPQFAVDALANLTLLESFNASNFFLPGPIPDWFGDRLSSLQALDLRFCSVNGAIPLSLGNLSNITGLYLANNRLAGTIPSSLGQLLRLLVLDLSHNLHTGSIPLSFASLGNLSLLDLSSNYLSESIPPAIGTLSKLQYLNLTNNMFSSQIPGQLGGLERLLHLDLSFNTLSGSVPLDLTELKNLRRLELGNNFLVGSLPENLFSNLTQLQSVTLKHNNFSGAIPDLFWSMASLRFLDVSENNFSGMLPNSSLNSNANGVVLNISHNKLYGGVTPIFRRFSVVDLSGNYFEGKVPNDLVANTSLDSNCLQNVSNQRTLAECSSFYAERGLTFDNFGFPNSTQPPAAQTSKKSNRNTIIFSSVFGGLGLTVLLVLLLLLLLCRQKSGSSNQKGTVVGPVPAGPSEPPPGASINFSSLGDSYKYDQLLQATSGFSDANLIKHGHSGDFFRGILENGINVVIKRVDLQSVKNEAYLLELDFFSKISHTRLVPLLGHCLENENEKFLVYKYMPNGDLLSALYRKTDRDDDDLQSLDWITRLKIALGAAEGLSFLHHDCTPPLVHRDVQASSILLDDKYEVRLGSLTEVCAQEGDGHQSRISRFLRLPQSSEQGSSAAVTTVCSYDVYCFGKVLLELVTGKMGISSSTEPQLKGYLDEILPYISIHDKLLVTKIVDPLLIVDEDLLEEVWAMAVVAKSCLNPKPSRRPLMRYVLSALENPVRVVREENSPSARLKATPSGGFWSAALFGSWGHSLSDLTVIPGASGTKVGGGSFKQSGTTGSQGSGQNGAGEHSSSRRRFSKEIVPEPSDVHDIERPGQD